MNGYVRWWRSIFEDPLWSQVPPAWFRVAFAVVGMATWKDQKWFDGSKEIMIPAGGLVTSRDSMCRKARVSPKEYRGAVQYLTKTGFLGQQTANKYTILTVKNWETYQGKETEEGQQTANKGPGEGQQGATSEESKKESRLLRYAPEAWPQTAAAVTSYFQVDDAFVGRIIGKARDAKPDATDEQIAQAVYVSYRPNQRTAGLFLSRVPEALRNGHAGRKPQSLAEQLLREVNACDNT